MKTFLRKMLSHSGRMYELFYWLSVWTDWTKQNYKWKQWIDSKEYYYWCKWVTK